MAEVCGRKERHCCSLILRLEIKYLLVLLTKSNERFRQFEKLTDIIDNRTLWNKMANMFLNKVNVENKIKFNFTE